jgi:hypothetical protein
VHIRLSAIFVLAAAGCRDEAQPVQPPVEAKYGKATFTTLRGEVVDLRYPLAGLLPAGSAVISIGAGCTCTRLRLGANGRVYDIRSAPDGRSVAETDREEPQPLAAMDLSDAFVDASIDTQGFPHAADKQGTMQVVCADGQVVSLSWSGRVEEYYRLDPAEVVVSDHRWGDDVGFEIAMRAIGPREWRLRSATADIAQLEVAARRQETGYRITGFWPGQAILQQQVAARISLDTTLGKVSIPVRVETKSVFRVQPGSVRVLSRVDAAAGVHEVFTLDADVPFRCVSTRVTQTSPNCVAEIETTGDSPQRARVAVKVAGPIRNPVVNVGLEVVTDHPFESAVPLRVIASMARPQ